MKNLAFHNLLKLKMIILPILTASLIHFQCKVGRIYFLNLGVKGLTTADHCELNLARKCYVLNKKNVRSLYPGGQGLGRGIAHQLGILAGDDALVLHLL